LKSSERCPHGGSFGLKRLGEGLRPGPSQPLVMGRTTSGSFRTAEEHEMK
jgi:hypothetical protein